jgi:hypothetical protein
VSRQSPLLLNSSTGRTSITTISASSIAIAAVLGFFLATFLDADRVGALLVAYILFLGVGIVAVTATHEWEPEDADPRNPWNNL